MKPSAAKKFFATKWPLRIWFAFTSLTTCVEFVLAAGFRYDNLKDWHMLCLYALLVGVTLPLGFMLGVFPGVLVVSSIMSIRVRENGGPFEIGDEIQIIGGPHGGTVTRIYARGQGVSVRLDLGADAKNTLKDIYFPIQILKVAPQQAT